jgi:integrase/recombinase XerD
MTDHTALPFDHWPDADRAAWLAAIQPADFPDAGGPGSGWRAASRLAALGAYGRLLGWLAATGVPFDAEAPADRITPERMEAYVGFLSKSRATVTRASYFGVLCMTVRAMFPNGDWRWLQSFQRVLRRKSSPSRGKERRIVPANQLRQLGLDLIERAGEMLDWPSEALSDRDRTAAARDYRDGLLIALLTSRPLRVRNLLGIEIGGHLRRSGRTVTLHFERGETKNKRPIHTVWPVALEPALARYESKVRPLLISARAPGKVPESPPGDALWVGQGGTVLTAGGLQKIFECRTRRRVGHVVNPHLFRDCVATSCWATDHSGSLSEATLL